MSFSWSILAVFALLTCFSAWPFSSLRVVQNNVLTDGVSSTRVALNQEVVADRVELASVSRHRKRVGFFRFDGVCVVIAVERGLSMIMSLSLAV